MQKDLRRSRRGRIRGCGLRGVRRDLPHGRGGYAQDARRAEPRRVRRAQGSREQRRVLWQEHARRGAKVAQTLQPGGLAEHGHAVIREPHRVHSTVRRHGGHVP